MILHRNCLCALVVLIPLISMSCLYSVQDTYSKQFAHCRVLRENGQFEDKGDFSDFYLQPSQLMGEDQQKELQEMQDEVCF